MKNNIKISLIEFKYTTMYCNVCNKYRKSKKKRQYQIFLKDIKSFYCLKLV